MLLRSAGEGAALSSMEAGPFDLQNPGGGDNLVDQTRFNIVPGRRYVLLPAPYRAMG